MYVYEPGNLDTNIYCYKIHIFNKRLMAFGVVGYMDGLPGPTAGAGFSWMLPSRCCLAEPVERCVRVHRGADWREKQEQNNKI